jgi:hypothetical protein
VLYDKQKQQQHGSRIVTDRPMCLAAAYDKAFENIDCMNAMFRCNGRKAIL